MKALLCHCLLVTCTAAPATAQDAPWAPVSASVGANTPVIVWEGEPSRTRTVVVAAPARSAAPAPQPKLAPPCKDCVQDLLLSGPHGSFWLKCCGAGTAMYYWRGARVCVELQYNDGPGFDPRYAHYREVASGRQWAIYRHPYGRYHDVYVYTCDHPLFGPRWQHFQTAYRN